MEKMTLLTEEAQVPPPPPQRKRRFHIHLLIAVVCLAFWYWPKSMDCPHHTGRRLYDGEKIEWQQCGHAGKHELECGEINVPMDQFNATNSGDKTFSIPLIRLRSENATKNLLLNPGGPGVSGLSFLYNRGEQFKTIIGDGFHLISYDPRGVNMSRPLTSCYPDEETRRRRETVRNAKPVEDSADLYAWSSNFAQTCADTVGVHGNHINTPQTAADMNSILDALGQEDMYYWGFSYGTILGQTYAALFPERSKRVIIDGVANQFTWYEELLELDDFLDSDSVFHGFAEECIKAGKNCSLSSLASTTDELEIILSDLGKELQSDRISVYINNTVYGALDYPAIWGNAIFPSLYKPATWNKLADNLAQLLNGNATSAFLEYGLGSWFSLTGDAHHVIHLNDGKSGAKYWPQKRTELLDMLLPSFNGTTFLALENKYHYIKQQWAIPRTHNFVPTKGVKTAFPLLILSTTYDPVCPLAAARVARDSFEGSRLIELKGYGHCTLAMESACIAKHVRAFFYEGVLPPTDVQCEADHQYFAPPEETAEFVIEAAENESEDQRIRAAQRKLTLEMEWQPRWF